MTNFFKKVGFNKKRNPAEIPENRMPSEERQQPVIETTIVSEVFANALSMRVVIEGVEYEARLSRPELTHTIKRGDEVEVFRRVGNHLTVRKLAEVKPFEPKGGWQPQRQQGT
ncbi:MAG: NfeD family protein [Bacteroidia bacterium]